ncbi:hypothetical protein OIY81_3330 [Cryptosporidium canis]|nr:hypothetical protein OIY81_3330 [Cryptosporidium canis]
MERNRDSNYDRLIQEELESKNWNSPELADLNDQLLESPALELQTELASLKINSILEKNKNARPVILLMLLNRLSNIANKAACIDAGKSLEENQLLPELMLLAPVITQNNVILDCCNYAKLSNEQDTDGSFVIEVLNAMIKVPTIAINCVLALRPCLKSRMDCKVLDKYIPAELHDCRYYGHIWVCILCMLNGPDPVDQVTAGLLQSIFNRLFLRGYRDLLCKIMVGWPGGLDKEPLAEGKWSPSRTFGNILNLNRANSSLISSFIKQLIKEVETSLVQASGGLIFLSLKCGDLKEFWTETSKESDAFLFLRSVIDFCVLEGGLDQTSGFLRNQVFLVKKQNFSFRIYLAFLDMCVINIVNKEERAKLFSPDQCTDYLYRIQSEKHAIVEESARSKAYLKFLNELTLHLAKQWSSYQESMTHTLTLSTVIVRAVSIIIYLNVGDLPGLKKTLLEFYLDITNGIQFRLKNIDPVIRSSAMFLGEFYFNLLYDLFPSTSEESDSGYSINEVPKFEELNLVNSKVKSQLAYIYNASRPMIIGETPDTHSEKHPELNTLSDNPSSSLDEEAPSQDQTQQIQDEDDEFWDKAPSLSERPKHQEIIRTAPLKGGPPAPQTASPDREESKRKLVNRSFDLLVLYTDENKSKQVPDRAEKLLKVLTELAEDLEKDDSDYDYIIQPLVNKLISLQEKDQKVLALVILSKLIQYRTDKVAVNMITYSFDINSGVPMDTRILVLSSLTAACQNLASSENPSNPSTRRPQKTVVNLFDRYSLVWASHLAKNLMKLIRLSEDQESFEKIPNIFFVSSLELFNQIVLNTSSSNASLDQIAHFGLELVASIDLAANHLLKDLAVRKSIYMLVLNIILQSKCSPHPNSLHSHLSPISAWLSKVETSEMDPTNIPIIQAIKSNMPYH